MIKYVGTYKDFKKKNDKSGNGLVARFEVGLLLRLQEY